MNTDVTKRLTYPSSPNLQSIEVHRYVYFGYENLDFMADVAVFLFLFRKITHTYIHPRCWKYERCKKMTHMNYFKSFVQTSLFELEFWCYLNIFSGHVYRTHATWGIGHNNFLVLSIFSIIPYLFFRLKSGGHAPSKVSRNHVSYPLCFSFIVVPVAMTTICLTIATLHYTRNVLIQRRVNVNK